MLIFQFQHLLGGFVSLCLLILQPTILRTTVDKRQLYNFLTPISMYQTTITLFKAW
jgi:hypothetical protein